MNLPETVDDALRALREAFKDHNDHALSLTYFNEPGRQHVHYEEEDGNTIVSFRAHRWLKMETTDLPKSKGWYVSLIWEQAQFKAEPIWCQRRDDAIRVMLESNRQRAWNRLFSCIVDATSFQGKSGRAPVG